MANYDRYQNPHARSAPNGRSSAGQRPPEGQRARSPRPDSRYRDDYSYDRRPPARRRRKKRHTGVIVFFTFCIAFLIGAYGGVWASVRYDVAKYLPGPAHREATPIEPTVLPTDIYSDPEEDASKDQQTHAFDEQPTDVDGFGIDELFPPFEDEPDVAPEDEDGFAEVAEPDPEPVEEPIPEPTERVEDPAETRSYVVYKMGDRDEGIKPIQEKLIELGILSDTADGVFGGKTQAALIEYQKSVGLEETGIADEQTQAKMFTIENPPVETQDNATPSSSVALSFGERNVIEGYCAIQLNQFNFGYEIMPSREDEDVIPVFFETETTETTFLYLDGEIENLSSEVINSQSIQFSVYTASFNEYTGFAAFELNDGLVLTKFADLPPNEKTRIVLCVEVPTELSQSEEAIGANATVAATAYQINVR